MLTEQKVAQNTDLNELVSIFVKLKAKKQNKNVNFEVLV